MEKIYRKFTCIDIGSTNSQIAQRYEESEDGGVTWKSLNKDANKVYNDPSNEDAIDSYLLKTDGYVDHPTVIICKDELSEEQQRIVSMENEVVCGREAEAIFKKNYNIPLRHEFKGDLYYSVKDEEKLSSEKEENFKNAQKYTRLFLRELKKRESAEAGYPCVEEKTIVTVPVSATDTLGKLMMNWAESAGWKNVEYANETDGIVKYALNTSSLFTKLSNVTVLQKLRYLVLDIGGSTADIIVVELSPDEFGKLITYPLGVWPEVGAKERLGAKDIDKKMCDWLQENGYILSSKAKELKEKNDFSIFRRFKEETSPILKNGDNNGLIDKLFGDIVNLTFGEKRTFSPKDYDDQSSKKIDRDVYIEEIFSEYALKLQLAVRNLLEECSIGEADIDGIILAGGGSLMYGIEELFRGEIDIDGKPFDFKKIKEDPSSLVLMKKNASGLCALGNVLPQPVISYRKHSLYKYILRVDLYTAKAGSVGGWDKEFRESPSVPDTFKRVYYRSWTLAEQGEALPLSNIECVADDIEIAIEPDEVIVCIVKILSRNKGISTFQYGWSSYTRRSLSKYIKDIFNQNNSELSGAMRFIVNIKENSSIVLKPTIKVSDLWGFMSDTKEANI